MDAFAIHICSVFMRKRGSRPSAKGRNRFFITAAAKRMRGVFFPMCKTRARSMAGLASRAFGGIRRFHVPLHAAKSCLQCSCCRYPLAQCRPQRRSSVFSKRKTVRPVFRGDTVWLILFLVLRLIQGAAQPFHGRTRAPYRASRCIPARSQKPQRRCSCIGACRT